MIKWAAVLSDSSPSKSRGCNLT